MSAIVPFTQTDGGRKEAGFGTEPVRDCVARGISVLHHHYFATETLGESYRIVHNYLTTSYNKSADDGVSFLNTLKTAKDFGFIEVAKEDWETAGYGIDEIAEYFPTAIIYSFGKTPHLTVAIDGTLYDDAFSNGATVQKVFVPNEELFALLAGFVKDGFVKWGDTDAGYQNSLR